MNHYPVLAACAVCVRNAPMRPTAHRNAETHVGPLSVCGHHVDEALRMVLAFWKRELPERTDPFEIGPAVPLRDRIRPRPGDG